MAYEEKTTDNVETLFNVVYEIVGEQLKEYGCSNEFEDFLVDDIIDYILKGTPQKIEKLYGIEEERSFQRDCK